jgi:TPR repeat protein
MTADDEFARLSRAAESGDTRAMFNLAVLLSDSGDLPGSEVWYLRAAELGDLDAMFNLACALWEKKEYDRADGWFLQAAEGGNIESMYNVGSMLRNRGDLDGAEQWMLKAANGDDSDAMHMLGVIHRDRGDLEGSVYWLRQAAETGHVDAMYLLGFTLNQQGDLTGARHWHEQAAMAGNIESMYSLGHMLKVDDPELAVGWYRRAADGGNVGAMSNLGFMLNERGEYQDAESWYRRAADGGGTTAMANLGLMLVDRGDLDGAEALLHQAMEGGHNLAMINLGVLRQDRGDLDGAAMWFQRAADLALPEGPSHLNSLQDKIASDPDMDVITFDTFDWELRTNREGFRQWRSKDSVLSLRFVHASPDFTSWDADQIREDVIDTLNLMESPSFNIEEWRRPEWLGEEAELPEQMKLLELECFPIEPAKCVATTVRHRNRGKVRYGSAIFLLFDECFWIVQLELEEGPDLGEREGAVARRVLEENVSAEFPIVDFNPYERRWDGMVPIEDDPLTRLRLLFSRLRDSIQLGNRVKTLVPFLPLDQV